MLQTLCSSVRLRIFNLILSHFITKAGLCQVVFDKFHPKVLLF